MNDITSRRPLSNGRVLKVRTYKQGPVLRTQATVAKIDGNFEVFRLFVDFSEIVLQEECLRGTQKRFEAQHASINWTALTERAEAFYAARSVEPA